MSVWDRQSAVTGESQSSAIDQGLRSYMLKVYNYMASGLLLTGLIAYFAAQAAVTQGSEPGQLMLTAFGQAIFYSPLKWLLMFAPLGMVIAIRAGVHRMNISTLQLCFWAFAAVMGISLSSIFLVYTGESIARTFFITAAMFGGMSIFGYSTKRDLSGMGHFLIMGVWGLIIAMIANWFLHSSALNLAISIIGVFVFTALIAYDTQKLKAMYYQFGGGVENMARISIMGALDLYIDVINLFIFLLNFFGNRR